MDQDVVAVPDPGLLHAVPRDAQGVDLALAGQHGIEEQLFPGVFDRLPGRAGGDAPQDGDAPGRAVRGGKRGEFDPPRVVPLPPEEPLSLQEVEVIESILFSDPEMAGDLLRRGGKAILIREFLQEEQDSFLGRSQGNHSMYVNIHSAHWKRIFRINGRGKDRLEMSDKSGDLRVKTLCEE